MLMSYFTRPEERQEGGDWKDSRIRTLFLQGKACRKMTAFMVPAEHKEALGKVDLVGIKIQKVLA
jgi:hypothetical protein